MSVGTGGLLAMSGLIACGVGAAVAYLVLDTRGPAMVQPTTGTFTPAGSGEGSKDEIIARLEEEVASLKRQLAEARITAAAKAAFPHLNPQGVSETDAASGDGGGGDGASSRPAEGSARNGPPSGRPARGPREARQHRGPTARTEENIREHLDRAAVDPPLSQEQKDALVRILGQHAEKMRDALGGMAPEGTAQERIASMREKLDAIRGDTRAALEGVITPAQIEALNLLPGQRAGGPGNPGGGPVPPGDRPQDGDRGPRRLRGER